MRHSYRSLKRFARYTLVGTSTFVIDLLLLYFFIDVITLNYLVGSGLAFVCAISVNYFISRRYVFKGTQRDMRSGYLNFIAIALVGLLIVVTGMYVLVSLLGVGYFIARFTVAVLTGFWNYLLNLFVTFKVAGKHE
jgi:putative flippase GtrA